MTWLGFPQLSAEAPEIIKDEAGFPVEVVVRCRTHGEPSLPVNACCIDPVLQRNGTKAIRVRDRRIEAAPTWLVIRRQRYRCKSCGGTIYEELPHIDEKHRITERLRDSIIMSAAKRPFRDVVAMHAVEETLVRRVFRRYADEKLLHYQYEAPRVLGIDENYLLGAARGVVLDIESGRLLDMFDGRSQAHVRHGLMTRMKNGDRIEVWCQDMAGSFKAVARDLFPKAQIVIDKFHVLMKASYIWNKIRLVETPRLPLEMRKAMPGIINMFNKHWEDLKPRSQDRVAEILETNARMKAAWTIKESFFYFYDKATRQEAEASFGNWVKLVESMDQQKEWKPLMAMVERNRHEIFNYFDHRFTSGKVERMNRAIGDMNRASNGMDMQTLRAKAILRYGRFFDEEHFRFYYVDAPPDELFQIDA